MFKKTAVLSATYQRPVNWRAHFPSGDGTYWTLAQCDLQRMWVGCSNEFNQPTVLNAITKYRFLYLAQRSTPGSLCKNAGSPMETLGSENIRFSINHYLQSILPFQYPTSFETDRIQNAVIFPHPRKPNKTNSHNSGLAVKGACSPSLWAVFFTLFFRSIFFLLHTFILKFCTRRTRLGSIP